MTTFMTEPTPIETLWADRFNGETLKVQGESASIERDPRDNAVYIVQNAPALGGYDYSEEYNAGDTDMDGKQIPAYWFVECRKDGQFDGRDERGEGFGSVLEALMAAHEAAFARFEEIESE